MGLGKRRESRQTELWIAADQLARTPRHVFYEKLNRVLAKARFDAWVEERCSAYYAEDGRRSIPPGVYFRMLLVGYFEGIDSQRGIAWRCADSRSLQAFLGYGPAESTPDHSSLTKIRERLPVELYAEVFQFVLTLVEKHKLLSATVVGVDSTTLEANAAMKSIVRKDTGESWNEYVTRLMREEGAIAPEEEPTADELRRYDRKRKDKKVSNDEWQSPHDPEAKITKMKDGRTHLAYKAEHVVDLKTEVILAAEVYGADEADTATLVPSLEQAQANVDATESGRVIEKAAADKGYHAADTLVECQELDLLGVKTYIPEPRGRRRWTDKTEEQKAAVLQNRARTQRAYGKRLQRKRSELVERSFAHVCDTGGGRRSWLRGLTNIRKRHLIAAAAHNLGLVLRKLLGAGKPRAYDDLLRVLESLYIAQVTLRKVLPNLCTAKLWRTRSVVAASP
jgi:transposase